jgi:hypothetical protein
MRCGSKALAVIGVFITSLLLFGVPVIAEEAPGPEESEGDPAEAQAQSSQAKPGGLPQPTDQPSHPGHKAGGNMAEKATDPSAILMQMQFQYIPRYIIGADTDSDTYIIQPVLPLYSSNVLRATIPFPSSPEPDRAQGLGDLVALDFFLFHTGSSSFGIGPALSFPTATNELLGSGKFSLGPPFLWMFKGVPKTLIGVLAENFTSVAGDSDRDDVNTFLFQPIVTHHFKWGYVGLSGQQWAFNWSDDNDRYSIPIGVNIGKVFLGKTPFNLAVEPYYTINRDAANFWGFRFQWSLIFPGFHW